MCTLISLDRVRNVRTQGRAIAYDEESLVQRGEGLTWGPRTPYALQRGERAQR